MKEERIEWTFQWWENFGFFIPKDREFFGWDFYVQKSNFWLARDWDKVEAIEIKSTWKKPEAKIVKTIGREKAPEQKYIEWLYSKWDGNFWFIDVEWQEKWYFVYGDKRNWARDGDRVKANVVEFKWKKEAIVVKVFEDDFETVIGRFKDSDRFGFVIPNEWENNDIFIPGPRKNGARDGDTVEAKIVKKWGKNSEGIVLRVL